MAGQTNKAQDYTEPRYDFYNPCSAYYTAPWSLPGADRAYKFTLANKSSVILSNVTGPDYIWLLDSTGVSTSYNNPCVDVGPGTYYVSVEQGSTTTSDNFGFQVSAIRTACAPTIAQHPSYPYPSPGYYNNNNMVVQVNAFNTASANLSSPIPLYVGGRNNALYAATLAGYIRLFVDFNADGDFDDASETIYTSSRRPPIYFTEFGTQQTTRFYDHTEDNFALSAGNTVFAGAVGKTLRMRAFYSDTLNGQGACGTYNTAEYKDYFVAVSNPGAATPPTQWLRQYSGLADEQYIRTRTAPDGSIYALGYLPLIQEQSNSYIGRNQAVLTSEPGNLKDVQAYNFHHQVSQNGLLVKYNRNGTVQWANCILANGDDGSGPGGMLTLRGQATDKFGYVYVCGSFKNSLIFYKPDGSFAGYVSDNLDATANSYRYQKGFVAKFHPNGNLVYAYQIGNGTNGYYGYAECTGIDVGPDLRVYVSGQFNGQCQIKGLSGTSMLYEQPGQRRCLLG